MAYVEGAVELIRRTGRGLTGGRDWLPAAGPLLGLLAVTELIVRGEQTGADLPGALLLGLFATVPLAFARAHPLIASATIATAALFGIVVVDWLPGAAVLAQAGAGYLLGRTASVRAVIVLGLPFVGYTALLDRGLSTSGPADPGGPAAPTPDTATALGGPLSALLLAAVAAVAVGIGWAARARGEAARRDASQRVTAETLLEHAARGERARIARELHDVVAHHISMIAVQAETARLTTPDMPAAGAERLLAIGDTARTALTEMRRLLGVLREDAQSEPTRAPQPGLRQLNELIDEARASGGGRTRLIVRGRVVPLDQGVELTTYRIIQEALTNARRHAPGAAVDVELHYLDDALRIRVRDNGPGLGRAPFAVTGHGLLGMRERAASLGGSVHVGPGPVTGVLVEADLPIPAADR
jgi:signal transduction histidine kinase